MENKPEPNKRLFVGSLPYRFSEGELLTLFVPFGRITSLRIMKNQWGKSRGIGFVEFDTIESAIQAKKSLHNAPLADRTMIVDYSKPDPLNTPEGLARHQQKEAQFIARHPQRQNLDQPTSSQTFTPSTRRSPNEGGPARRNPKIGDKPTSKFGGTSPKKFYTPQRQSVYDSRAHHSKVGAKFAAKTKKK